MQGTGTAPLLVHETALTTAESLFPFFFSSPLSSLPVGPDWEISDVPCRYLSWQDKTISGVIGYNETLLELPVSIPCLAFRKRYFRRVSVHYPL